MNKISIFRITQETRNKNKKWTILRQPLLVIGYSHGNGNSQKATMCNPEKIHGRHE